jgi:NYN domain
VDHSSLIAQISVSIHTTIVAVQQQQPNLLAEKYRTLLWNSDRCKSVFLEKIALELGKASDKEAIFAKAQQLLKSFLLPPFFATADCQELLVSIKAILGEFVQQTNSQSVPNRQKPDGNPGIAILFLDTENIQLSEAEEKFLTDLCRYRLQIKIAFANWRNASLAKKDVDFHNRGYQMIHVPNGKNSADMKMTAIGSSIFIYYPTVKEVLVCSSDKDLTHLCNNLQAHGLIVHQIKKQTGRLVMVNLTTGESNTYHPVFSTDILSFDHYILPITELIREQQKETLNQWIKLSHLSQKFQAKYGVTIEQIINLYTPEKTIKAVFLDYPANFVVHQLPDDPDLYISLFTSEAIAPASPLLTGILTKANVENFPKTIASKSDLEQVLANILMQLTAPPTDTYVSIVELHSKFQTDYGQPIKHILQRLQLNQRYIDFLKSCNAFDLRQQGHEWHITFKSNPSA